MLPSPGQTWPPACAQLDEQLGPAFSNLIVEYWSIEGSIFGKEASQATTLVGRRDSMRQGLSMNFQEMNPIPEQRRES
jgi:hypothetical protein